MLVLLLLLAAAVAVLPGQEWTDRAEYDLALAIRAEASAAARLPLLAAWKQKYPKSALGAARAELTLAAAQSLGDKAKTLEAARELVAADANHFNGLYWLTLLAPSMTAAKDLAEAESAAKRLAASKAIPAAQKTEVLTLAHRALAWAAWRRNDLPAAEKELRAGLTLTPRHAELSAWLGAVLAVQKEPARQIAAVWHLARASYLDGDGGLGSAARRDVRGLLEAVYGGYHGGLDGLDEIGTASRAAVDPPSTFKVETAAELAQRKADEEMEKNNPQLFTWVKLKRRLTAADGEAQYAKLAESTLPLLKGYVVRCDQDPKPNEVILGIEDSAAEEVVVKFEAPMERCAEVGVAVEFEGKPTAITREPAFRLTVVVPAALLRGWPAAAPADEEKPAGPPKKK